MLVYLSERTGEENIKRNKVMSDKPERPTCSTCIHFDPHDVSLWQDDISGDCCLNPEPLNVASSLFCGQHSDFSEYLRVLREWKKDKVEIGKK